MEDQVHLTKTIILASALLLLSSIDARALVLSAKDGKTEFLAIGRPSAIKIAGEGLGPQGEVTLRNEKGTMVLDALMEVDLESFETGISMRDRHMKEKYLETGKYKTAVLKIKSARIPAANIEAGGEAKLSGTLLLHNLEKPVEVTVTFTRQGEQLTCDSKFKIKLSDYAIDIPTFSGITVADEVEIRASTRVSKSDLKDVKQ
jgi:polyisoprenoid-binding protein YceI